VAREKSARLIWERVSALKTELPVVLAGDFNAAAGTNPAYGILIQPDRFQDTWNTAAEHRGAKVGTFHGFKGPVNDGPRIDWILTRGPVQASAIEIITYQENSQFPQRSFSRHGLAAHR